MRFHKILEDLAWKERRVGNLYQKMRKEVEGLRREKERGRKERDSVELHVIEIRRRGQEAIKNTINRLSLQSAYRHVS